MQVKQITNGLDVTRLLETIAAVDAQPELAGFKFRISNRWLGAAANQSQVQGFYGCAQEMEHTRSLSMIADEPEVLLGQDQGANAGEVLLHALAACITTSIIYHAAARGIALDAVESSLEGDVDLRGFLGIDPSVRNGFQQIRVIVRIRSNATDEQIQEIAALGPAFSPIYDSITRGLPVAVTAERME
jgi:uncharacterized OsmC-like protein